LLLGERYLLLRREFLAERTQAREIPAIARRVLVTLGGSDSENVTATVIQALQHVKIDRLEATVVVGGSNPHLARLREVIKESHIPIHLEHNVANVAPLMQWADIAVSAAGSTVWELAYMGLPSLLVVTAENQRPIAEGLESLRATHNLGWRRDLTIYDITRRLSALAVSAELRRLMSERGSAMIDGHGADRVVMALRGEPLWLRTVQAGDCRLLWEWANDPDVRAVSFAAKPIPWPEHQHWFCTKLKDPHCLFYIATDSEDAAVGRVCYDLDNNQAVISVSLDRHQRNRGYGSLLLRLSAQTVFATTTVTLIHAHIKPENLASIRAFEKAGYKHAGMTSTAGQPAVHLTLAKRSVSRGMPQ
jgi:RimJ/RimL family protein N-acetyltransferase